MTAETAHEAPSFAGVLHRFTHGERITSGELKQLHGFQGATELPLADCLDWDFEYIGDDLLRHAGRLAGGESEKAAEIIAADLESSHVVYPIPEILRALIWQIGADADLAVGLQTQGS